MGLANLVESPKQRFNTFGLAKILTETPEASGLLASKPILTSKHPTRKGKIRNEGYVKLTTRREEAVPFRLAMQKTVVDLVRDEGNASPSEGRVGSPHLSSIVVANPGMLNPTLLNSFSQTIHQAVNAKEGNREMDLVEIYRIQLETRETGGKSTMKRTAR
tara:strand:- start:2439 stop:2921 length:483 start_codon:yes stop_codon:yes gene_type:complete